LFAFGIFPQADLRACKLRSKKECRRVQTTRPPGFAVLLGGFPARPARERAGFC